MTQRTINLYDGLEALYYFDPTYYDGTAGEIKDKSGNGRHAVASGGPTVGVEGPDDFEATSFDGTDDSFNFDATKPVEQTLFAVFKATDANANTSKDRGWVIGGQTSSSGSALGFNTTEELTFQTSSINDTNIKAAIPAQQDRWYAVVGRFDGTNLSIVNQNGEVGTNTQSADYQKFSGDRLYIGKRNSSFGWFGGQIAAAGKWSRALSDAEAQHLTNLTAPRRQLL